jgi:hypothetical protein
MTKYKSQLEPVVFNNRPDITHTSGNTLLILLVQNLPATYSYKSWLVAAAPAVTMTIKFLWKLIIKELTLFRNRKEILKNRIKLKQVMAVFFNDPDISDQAKEALRKRKEKEEWAIVEGIFKRLEVLRRLT